VQAGLLQTRATIERGTPVRNRCGTLGWIDHVLIDDGSDKVSHLVIRRGLLPYYPVLPVARVDLANGQTVRVAMTRDELDDLPLYRRRATRELEAELRHSLQADDDNWNQVKFSTKEGVVCLQGSVRDREARRRVIEIGRAVEGVIAVENELVTTQETEPN
jgi:hypothetical protein